MTDFLDIPVTRRAKVVLVGRLEYLSHGVTAIATATGRCTLPPETLFVLRPSESAPFRSGIGAVRDDLTMDIWSIPAAAHGDLLYRVEPA